MLITEFLRLVEHGLADDPGMFIDLDAYAARNNVDVRTAYRHVGQYRAILRSLREEGVHVSVTRDAVPDHAEKADSVFP